MHAWVPDQRRGGARVVAERSDRLRQHVGFTLHSLVSVPRFVAFSYQPLQWPQGPFASPIHAAQWPRLFGLVASSRVTVRCNSKYDASFKQYGKLCVRSDRLDTVDDRSQRRYARPCARAGALSSRSPVLRTPTDRLLGGALASISSSARVQRAARSVHRYVACSQRAAGSSRRAIVFSLMSCASSQRVVGLSLRCAASPIRAVMSITRAVRSPIHTVRFAFFTTH
jgi:hypothetical protein